MSDIHDGQQRCWGRAAGRAVPPARLHGEPRQGPQCGITSTHADRARTPAAELIRTGLSDKEIARRLNISLATTRSYVHNLLGKLKVQRRGEVVGRLRA